MGDIFREICYTNMLSNASNSRQPSQRLAASLYRRYSLFNVSNNQPSTGRSREDLTRVDPKNSVSGSKSTSVVMVDAVCQRCKTYEVDLTNTSDNLSATDTELQASRQVISLLQRQLELNRIEKDSLEKLIISQSNNSFEKTDADLSDTVCNIKLVDLTDDSPNVDGRDSQAKLTEGQQTLLNLIRTQLYAKDEDIVKLRYGLKEAQNDKEQLILKIQQLEEDNAKLKDENLVLRENLTLRDQTIVSLSNEVFEQGNPNEFSPHRRQSNVETLGSQRSLIKTQRHVAKLVDTLEAYKKTNELLSNNVTKLTERCSQTEKKEIETRSQCQELEAKCCQIQSKLLSLLKEIEQSSNQLNESGADTKQEVICSESVKVLIKRLLEDKSLDIPPSWRGGDKSSKGNIDVNKISNSKYECDELGFYIVVVEREPSNDQSSPRFSDQPKRYSGSSTTQYHLASVDEATEVNEETIHDVREGRKRSILSQISIDATKNDQVRWHQRWDNFIKDFSSVDLRKSKEFKSLLRSGVPQEYRCKVWKALVDLRIGKERQRLGQDYYQNLLEPKRSQTSSKSVLNPSSKQIELDLLRTLPNNKHFETLDSSGTVRLRRVLTAYSEHNQKVGYCQGMNRLAAVALLVLPEEEAFWCLTTIIDDIMPPGYYNDLWLAQVDSSVVMNYIAIKMPNLSEHFKRNNIELSLFAWFLTIFVDGTPPALFLRLWDSFLYEGDKILFRVAIALLKINESHLLELNNSVAVNNFLRSTVNSLMDIDKFFDVAFDWINPLSTKSLNAKRQHNFDIMRSDFEKASRSFTNPSPTESYKVPKTDRHDDSPCEDSSIISI